MIKDKSIFIKNIYYMLSYAFKALNHKNFENIATESFDNIQNMFAAILAKGIGQQLKQGLYREYINNIDDLVTMRGKINMPGTIRNRIAKRQVLTCEYDELSENNLFNQIIKTTALLLIKSKDVDTEYKDTLKKEMLMFSGVEEIDLTLVRWADIRFQRNNMSYQMLISICWLIAEGMLLSTDKGEQKLASFIDEQHMCRLYEKFILEYYYKEFPELDVGAKAIDWMLDDDVRAMLPVMQSDIMLQKDGKVLIIDAKYYSHTTQSQYDTHTVHSANLYQIFTYVKNKEEELSRKAIEHEVAGMLLYARTDEDIQPNQDYKMSGNKISVKTLDLGLEFSDVAKQLDCVAKEYFQLQHN